ncbi:cell division topological specificity factor MinE [Acidaminobacter sp.]|uniref:cell division topological specificity factor MinE n=1 Tax=Acidaminobacter sp. TaxID=1872102 RepID=UPI00255EC9C5|nr:cell division topological specificity factor MinE [Acidaminobacter sp.]MDK9709784.1 cell division topological specificity factor MinE [Acidaminobacter sp.]
MFDLLKFLSRQESSKNVAKERLRLVLVHDRANCSPELLDLIKEDLITALSKHIEIDQDGFDIQITKTDASTNGLPALVANIPIRSMKRS